jgi:hypothetical protein
MNVLFLGLRHVLRHLLYWPAKAIQFCAVAAACGGVVIAFALYHRGNASSAAMSLLVAAGCVVATGLLVMLLNWLDKPRETRA